MNAKAAGHRGTSPGRYDMHTHVVPPMSAVIEQLLRKDVRWARLETGTASATHGDVVVAGKLFRRIRREAFDLAAREDELRSEGVSGQLLSAMPELFATWAPPRDSLTYCRAFNAWLAEEVRSRGTLFTGLGIVPVQDPDLATTMLAEVTSLGLVGVEIPSQSPAGPWHTDAYAEFFGEAERLGLLLFIHSVGTTDGFTYTMAGSSAIFPARIGEALAGLIANGVMERHPDLRILCSHAGGGLPASLARIDFVRQMAPEIQAVMPQQASVYASRMWFDHLSFSGPLLAALVDLVGSDRIVYGTDYPFMRGDVEKWLDTAGLGSGFRAAVTTHNPRTLLHDLARPSPALSARVSGGIHD